MKSQNRSQTASPASGHVAGIMVKMAIPSFGGMVFAMITMFVVPVLYAAIHESKIKRSHK